MTSDQCPHDDFVVLGTNYVGHGTCAKCSKQLQLNLLINNWKKRMEQEVKDAVKKALGQ